MYSTGKSKSAEPSFSCSRMKSYILKSSAGKPIMVSTMPIPAGMGMASAPREGGLEQVAGGIPRDRLPWQRRVHLGRRGAVLRRQRTKLLQVEVVEGCGVLAEQLAPAGVGHVGEGQAQRLEVVGEGALVVGIVVAPQHPILADV